MAIIRHFINPNLAADQVGEIVPYNPARRVLWFVRSQNTAKIILCPVSGVAILNGSEGWNLGQFGDYRLSYDLDGEFVWGPWFGYIQLGSPFEWYESLSSSNIPLEVTNGQVQNGSKLARRCCGDIGKAITRAKSLADSIDLLRTTNEQIHNIIPSKPYG